MQLHCQLLSSGYVSQTKIIHTEDAIDDNVIFNLYCYIDYIISIGLLWMWWGWRRDDDDDDDNGDSDDDDVDD